MRRPLDWIVVSISLMVLFANRMLVDKNPEFHAAVPAVEAAPATATLDVETPFAWIREDGSQVFLTASGTRVAGPVKSPDRSTTNALYTWSSPLIATDKKAPSFQ